MTAQKHSKWRTDSIICDYTERPYCYLTGSVVNLDVHHIMNGPLRKWSDKNGLWVYLNHDVHMALHQTPQGQAWARRLKQEAQQAFEKTNSREAWMKKVGKNYL